MLFCNLFSSLKDKIYRICKIGICRLLEPSMTVLLMLFVCLSGLFIRYEIHFTCSLNFSAINGTYNMFHIICNIFYKNTSFKNELFLIKSV